MFIQKLHWSDGYNGVFSNRQPGRLPGNFDNRYAWVQILAPECQEPVQMKLKI